MQIYNHRTVFESIWWFPNINILFFFNIAKEKKLESFIIQIITIFNNFRVAFFYGACIIIIIMVMFSGTSRKEKENNTEFIAEVWFRGMYDNVPQSV